MKIKTGLLCIFVILWFIFPGYVYPQSFSKVLEIRTPRMNGPDVSSLQNRLIFLGFNRIGAADGYYGPRIESVVRDIQKFAGFNEDGKVDRVLWNFIFSNDEFNRNYLAFINNVSQYNKDELHGIQGNVDYEYWLFDFTIYFARDGIIKILAIEGGTDNMAYSKEYYFIDLDNYFVVYKSSGISEYYEKENVFYRSGNYLYEVKLGKADHPPKEQIDDSELLGILYSLRFR